MMPPSKRMLCLTSLMASVSTTSALEIEIQRKRRMNLHFVSNFLEKIINGSIESQSGLSQNIQRARRNYEPSHLPHVDVD